MMHAVLKLFGPCDICLVDLLPGPPMPTATLCENLRTHGGNELHLCPRHWDAMLAAAAMLDSRKSLESQLGRIGGG